MNIRDRLLTQNIFVYNDYFEKYIQLINDNKDTKCEKFRTQSHHIIPVSYFIKSGTEVDNSPHNLVNLLYKDHILAHYYLALCVGDEYKNTFAEAFIFLIKRIPLISDHTKCSSYIQDNIDMQELIQQLPMYQSLYECVKKSQHSLNKGGKWMNNGTSQRYVRPSDIEKFYNDGFVIGKLPMSETTREKMSKNKPTLGRVVINNGVTNKFVNKEEIPLYIQDGWEYGRFDADIFRGRKLTDSQREKISKSKMGTIPWNKGKTKLTDERVQQYSTANEGQFKKGHSPWNKGVPHSTETIHKMKEAALKRIQNKE